MNISIFQALTLLLEKYQEDNERHQEAKKLYLSGVKTPADLELLNRLLQDAELSEYSVSGTDESITNDPVRRYFESHLAHETLLLCLDELDKHLLKKHFDQVFEKMPKIMQVIVPIAIYDENPEIKKSFFYKQLNKFNKSATAAEYQATIKKLKDPTSFDSLKPKSKNKSDEEKEAIGELAARKEKMLIMIKTVQAAMTAVNQHKAKHFPLDLYGQENYVYDSKNRGRANKEEPVQDSRHLGIMKSNMPIPRDALYSDQSSGYARPVENSVHVPGTQQVDASFSSGVTPFVNSISGTLLCQLRVMKKLMDENKFEYQNEPEQLKLFFKIMVSSMLFNSGGHSLDEFLRVLQLPEIQTAFKEVPGFQDCSLEHLFKETHKTAFEEAVKKTVLYNQSILLKNKLNVEIKNKKSEKHSQFYSVKSDDLLNANLSNLRLNILSIRKNINNYLDSLLTKIYLIRDRIFGWKTTENKVNFYKEILEKFDELEKQSNVENSSEKLKELSNKLSSKIKSSLAQKESLKKGGRLGENLNMFFKNSEQLNRDLESDNLKHNEEIMKK